MAVKENRKTTSDTKEKANILNRQFESVFSNDTAPASDLLPPVSDHPTMAEINITTGGVLKMLKQLQVHKAAGPDEISPRLLKDLADSIAPALTSIYRKSYVSSKVLEDWLRANVTPIYK